MDETAPTGVHGAPLRTRVLQGAGIVVALTLFNFPVRGSQLNPPLWMLIAGGFVLAIAGGVGGAVYHATDDWRARGGRHKTLASVLSLLSHSLLVFAVLLGALALVD